MRYLRSLSFIQGTAVNFLRTSILFLMLYLIYTRAITVGQFFSLFIYSFFIFGPLQEIGNVINVYRETEASLTNFEDILRHAEGAAAAESTAASRSCGRWTSNTSASSISRRRRPRFSDISFQVARGETIAFVGPSGAGQDDTGQIARGALRAAGRPHILYNGDPSTRRGSQSTFASALASSRRTRSSSPAPFARTCSSCTPAPPMPSVWTFCAKPRATTCWRVPTRDLIQSSAKAA